MDLTDDSPIAALAAAIEEAALRCAEPLQQWMNFPTDEEQKEKWLQIVWEHVFLLMHLVNRNAYGTLDETTHRRLMGELAPLVVMPLAQELSESRPDDIRQRTAKEAFEGLNQTEREYAECEGFLAEPVLTGDSLVSVFARKVRSLVGGLMQPALTADVVKRTVEAYKGLTLKDRIAAIAGFLQSDTTIPPGREQGPGAG
jgi:hypothetical protein